MSTPTLTPAQMAEDRSQYIIASVASCLTLAVIVTFLRLVARRIQHVRLNMSDYLAIASMVSAVCIGAMCFAAINYGFGRHVQTDDSAQLETFMQLFFAAEIFYVTTISLAKFSILALYCSLFPGKKFAMFAYGIGAFVLAWATACIFGVIFSCVPVQGYWNFSIHSTCIDSTKFFIGNAIPNMFSDAFILALPMKKIWDLQMSVRQKAVVSGMFLLGSFVTVASILRLVLLFNENLADPTYGLVNAFTWSNIEVDVAVVSASLPTLRPVFQWLWPKQFMTKIGKSTAAGTHGKYGHDTGFSMASMGRKPGAFHTLDDGQDDSIDEPQSHSYSATAVADKDSDTFAHDPHNQGIYVSRGVEQRRDGAKGFSNV